MSLPAGTSVGPFSIVARLGAGGMGEVYRARDTRLDRDVALKILPTELAADPDRLARFTREARLASQLTHPNIVVLHDVGAADGINYLAMELVEGPTLREWLLNNRPSLSKRIAIAAQIADGLAHAHRAGIVHRDLKPDNVMITSDGRAKILDFGIARQLLAGATVAPTKTLDQAGTARGVLLGTVPYMSPEQARGETVDYRSDQFALGTMIHEMVAGKNPFAKGSSLHTLSAIVELEVPPLTSTDSTLPVPLAWIVSRCLAKEPVDRYDSTADLARDLKNIAGHMSGSGAAQPVAPRRTSRAAKLIPMAAVAVLAAAAGWFAASRGSQIPPVADAAPTFRQLTFRRGQLQSARFTPDGASIVFSGAWDGKPFELGMLRESRPEAQRLNLPPAAIYAVSRTGELAIGRDCRWVPAAQACPGTLAVSPIGEGAPRNLAEGVSDADWSPDGTALAAVLRTGNETRLEYPLGTVLHRGRALSHLRFSPDGRQIAFNEGGDTPGINNNTIRVIDAKGGDARVLADGLRFPNGVAWSSDGREVWFSHVSGDDRLNRVSAVTLTGVRREVFQQSQSVRLLDVARDGRVLLVSMNGRIDMWLRRSGAAAEPLSWFDSTVADGLSIDGRSVLFSERGGANRLPSYSLYLRELGAVSPVFLGEGRGMDISLDKTWVLANRSPATGANELIAYPTGIGTAHVLATGAFLEAFFLPDSHGVVFASDLPRATFLTSVDGGTPRPLSHVAGAIDSPLAPDGQRFVVLRTDGSRIVSSLSGPVAPELRIDLKPTEFIRQWTEDGRGLYVQDTASLVERRITRLEIATGRRSEIAVLTPPDASGLMPGFSLVHMTRDAKTIVFSVTRSFGDLVMASGAR